MPLTFDSETAKNGFSLPDWLKPRTAAPAPTYDDVFALPVPGIDELPANVTPAEAAAAKAAEAERKRQESFGIAGRTDLSPAAGPRPQDNPNFGGYITGRDANGMPTAQAAAPAPVVDTTQPFGIGIYGPDSNAWTMNAEMDEQKRRNDIANATSAGYSERRNKDGSYTITGADGRQFVVVAPSAGDPDRNGTPPAGALDRYMGTPIRTEPFGGGNDVSRKYGPGGDRDLREIGNPWATQYQGTDYGGIVPVYPWGDAPPNTPAGREGLTGFVKDFRDKVGVDERIAAGKAAYSGVRNEDVAATPEGATATVKTGARGPSTAGDYWENGVVPLGPDGTPLPSDVSIPPSTDVQYYKMTAAELAAFRAANTTEKSGGFQNEERISTEQTAPVGFAGDVAPPEYRDGKGHYWNPQTRQWHNVNDGSLYTPGGGSAQPSPASAGPVPGSTPQPQPAAPAGPPPEVQIRNWLGTQAGNAGLAIPVPESTTAGTVRSQWPPEVTLYYYNASGTKKIVKELDARLESGIQYYVEFTKSEAKGFTPENSRAPVGRDIELLMPGTSNDGGKTFSDIVPEGYTSPNVDDRRGDPAGKSVPRKPLEYGAPGAPPGPPTGLPDGSSYPMGTVNGKRMAINTSGTPSGRDDVFDVGPGNRPTDIVVVNGVVYVGGKVAGSSEMYEPRF